MSKAIADSGLRVPCHGLQGFFESWFSILKPVHKLSNKEIQLISTMARFRYELSQKISDADLLDEVLMSAETKQKIREACGITQQSYQVSMFKLKKAKVIVDNKIEKSLLPNFKGSNYKLLLYFDIRDDGTEQSRQNQANQNPQNAGTEDSRADGADIDTGSDDNEAVV